MYCINKVVGWVMSPMGILFLGLGLSYALRRLRLRVQGDEKTARLARLSKWIAGLTLAFTWVFSCGATTRLVGAALESRWAPKDHPHDYIGDIPQADAIVVLGGGIGVHAECGAPEMYSAADRVWHGARLFKAGKSKRVVLSGPLVELSTVPVMSDFGVPREAMIYFSEARNTEEEARFVREYLKDPASAVAPRILLVTSAWHMSRAKLLFERAGLEVVPAPADFELSCALEAPMEIWDFLPSADAMARNSYAVKELIANVGYRLLRR